MLILKNVTIMKLRVNKNLLIASFAKLPITDSTSHPPKNFSEQYPKLQEAKAIEMMIKILHQSKTRVKYSLFSKKLTVTLITH